MEGSKLLFKRCFKLLAISKASEDKSSEVLLCGFFGEKGNKV